MAQQTVHASDKRKRYDDMPELPEDTPAMLVSDVYSGDERAIYLKFYDPKSQKIYFWRDRTGHRPYCYTKIHYTDQVFDTLASDSTEDNKYPVNYTFQRVVKNDIISGEDINTIKVIAPDPLAIGGSGHAFREKVPAWEADIRYYETYLFDTALIVGAYYVRKGNALSKYEYPISENVELALKNLLWDKIKEGVGVSGKEYRYYITEWTKLLNQPVPDLKRLALDIEVESEQGRMPNPRDHDRRITAIGLVGSDGMKRVFVLGSVETNGQAMIPEAELCATERELLSRTFAIMKQYPILLTFNGDDFDLPYMYMRAQDPRIDPSGGAIPKEDIPILLRREAFDKKKNNADPVGIRHGIHIDLYRTFDNRSIQIYAFSKAYSDKTLNAISEALLQDTKFEYEGDISDLPMQTLAQYCLKDADLTCRLSAFGDNLLMKLLIIICRIGKLPLDDVARSGVNQWIRGMLYYEHRQRNELIPSRRELEAKGGASTKAVIQGKNYQGADVIDPIPGVHFNVVVVDFASLYPSIIKIHNLSYETINCMHDDCKATNPIEGTNHWTCKQKQGLASLLIGSLRDLRVNYYKHLSKDKSLPSNERQLYNVVSQAVKVILNASYGVLGFESFPLFCLPVADSTTALGRVKINRTKDKAALIGVLVIYGDTDSLFLENPSKPAIEELIKWAKETLGVDLEVDKEYKYAVFSKLKKNYLGVRPDGTVDVKGLTGKKSHTPPFIKKTFYAVLEALGKVNNDKEFVDAKINVTRLIRDAATNLLTYKLPIEEMSFNTTINKSLDKYGAKDGKGLPQHIKAAKLLTEKTGRQINVGDKISYVKGIDCAIPVQLAKPQDIDVEKYLETMESIFEQILSPLDVDFKTVLGKPKQQKMEDLWV